MTKTRHRFPGSDSDRINGQAGVTNGLTRRNFTGFLAASAALSVSGCALIVPEPAPEVYDLVIGEGLSDIQGRASGQILITEPKVLNSLNSDRIVIRPSASQITYFPKVRWSDRLPRMVQLYLSRAYSLSGGARAVGLPGDGLIIDYQLLFDLRDFQIERTGSGFMAKVTIAMRILNDRNGRVVASRIFEQSAPSTDEPVAAIQALNGVLNDLTNAMIAWTYRTV